MTGTSPWRVRRAALIGAAVFCGLITWKALGVDSEHSASIGTTALWSMVAAIGVYALGVSAEDILNGLRTWKGQPASKPDDEE